MSAKLPDPSRALSPADVGALLDVSRETLERFAAYLDLLARWQRTINLVGPATLADPWRRHILDCAQLRPSIPASASSLVDMGSGAGLPGLILAIMGVNGVHLIESDRRKAAFLREAARACGAEVTIHTSRIEQVRGFPADVVTARALAPLPLLLELAAPFLHPGSVCLFPKGRNVADELTLARETVTMRCESHASLVEPDSQILMISEIRRVPSR